MWYYLIILAYYVYAFQEFYKPDIAIGTESWLHKDIPDCELFTASLRFNQPIRKDRPEDIKGGGVFILLSQRLVVSEQPQHSTNSEIVSAKVQVITAKPLLIAAYYRPSEHEQVSAEKLPDTWWLIQAACLDPTLNRTEENQQIIKQIARTVNHT